MSKVLELSDVMITYAAVWRDRSHFRGWIGRRGIREEDIPEELLTQMKDFVTEVETEMEDRDPIDEAHN